MYSKRHKMRGLLAVIFFGGFLVTGLLAVNPPVLNRYIKLPSDEPVYAENAWIISALITFSLLLIIYSLKVLHVKRKRKRELSQV